MTKERHTTTTKKDTLMLGKSIEIDEAHLR